jgi:hypothetical protein
VPVPFDPSSFLTKEGVGELRQEDAEQAGRSKSEVGQERPGPAATCFSALGSDPFEREQAFDLVRLFGSCLSKLPARLRKAYDRRESCSSLSSTSTADRARLKTAMPSSQRWPRYPAVVVVVWIRQMDQRENKDAPETSSNQTLDWLVLLPITVSHYSRCSLTVLMIN